MKMIELKDKILEIGNCRFDCPFFFMFENRVNKGYRCKADRDIMITLEDARISTPVNCPLKDMIEGEKGSTESKRWDSKS